MDSLTLLKVLEHLRQGSPPYGMSSRFTVGDDEEIKKLEALICGQGPHLIEAEAGYGKSHLLEHVREKALDQQFLVSLTRLDSTGEVRFNRFDQIVGAIFRNLEAPQTRAGKGVEPFMNTLCDAIQQSRFKGLSNFWVKLTNDSKWDGDIHGLIESPALYIALRAWFFGGDLQRRLVEDWLGHPWRYIRIVRVSCVISLKICDPTSLIPARRAHCSATKTESFTSRNRSIFRAGRSFVI